MNVERVGQSNQTGCSMEVGWAQQELNRVGAGKNLAVDGILGPRTENAIRDFQQSQGLPETGALNLATTRALESAPTLPETLGGDVRHASSTTHNAGVQFARVESEDGFQRYARANNEVESHNTPVYSSLRTVGDAPASFGRGQLLLRDHLSELNRLRGDNPDLLSHFGTSRSELARMDTTASRANDAYRAIVSNDTHGLQVSSETRDAVAAFRSATQPVTDPAMCARLQSAFGVTANELGQLGLALDLHSLRALYLDTSARRGASEAYGQATHDPRSVRLLEALGESSLRHYVTRGALAEDRNGFIMGVTRREFGEARVDTLLRSVDSVTTESRLRRNFASAERAMSNVTDVDGRERDVLLSLAARQFHAAPGTASRELFRQDQPRFRDAESLRGAIVRMNAGRHHSDSRPLNRFEAAARLSV